MHSPAALCLHKNLSCEHIGKAPLNVKLSLVSKLTTLALGEDISDLEDSVQVQETE